MSGVGVLSEKRRGLVDALLLQIGWWAAVLGAADGRPWSGSVAVGAALCVHLAIRPAPARTPLLGRASILAAIGTAVDSTLLSLGVLGFPGSDATVLVPVWITALWAQFAVAPDVFAFLRGRPGIAAGLGAVAGPLAYAGGARLGAAEIAPGLETATAVLALGSVWAVVLPALLLWPPSVRLETRTARSAA